MKRSAIFLPNVDHSALYSMSGQVDKNCVKVPRAATQGYLRGWVEIQDIRRIYNGGYCASAVLQNVFSGIKVLCVITRGWHELDDWAFCSHGLPTLYKISTAEIQQALQQNFQKQEILRQEEKILRQEEETLNQLRNISAVSS